MRIGKWVRIYQQLIPIPRRMSMSFGLFENSELHVVPLPDVPTHQMHESELMISPVPLRSWRSVCRLSVRLQDKPGSLARATAFLREEHINILLSESCSTYQGRAHWDAICDLSQAPTFSKVANIGRKNFEAAMLRFLNGLTERYESFAQRRENRHTFLMTPNYVQFSALTGLNDASFVCLRDLAETVHHRAGTLRLSDSLVRYVSEACGFDPPAMPHYALVTGNTEQRYMRVLFLKDHKYMFRLTVDNHLPDFAGSGIGVLHQFLSALSPDVNLMRASNYIFEKRQSVERGRIDLIGHWNIDRKEGKRLAGESIAKCLEREFTQLIERIEIADMDGTKHKNALKLVRVATAATAYPRVYISYSVGHDDAKLELLMSALTDANYEPVLGTKEAPGMDELIVQENRVGGRDALKRAFGNIDGCVALVSLQTKRPDYHLKGRDGKMRYVVPPWLIAEEIYAWSSPEDPLIVRLKDVDIHDSTYNRNIEEIVFDEGKTDSYDAAVKELINKLNEFKNEERFPRLKNSVSVAQYRPRYAPPEIY